MISVACLPGTHTETPADPAGPGYRFTIVGGTCITLAPSGPTVISQRCVVERGRAQERRAEVVAISAYCK